MPNGWPTRSALLDSLILKSGHRTSKKPSRSARSCGPCVSRAAVARNAASGASNQTCVSRAAVARNAASGASNQTCVSRAAVARNAASGASNRAEPIEVRKFAFDKLRADVTDKLRVVHQSRSATERSQRPLHRGAAFLNLL